MKINTLYGFSCEVNEKKASDWRFVKALAKCDGDDDLESIEAVAFMVPFLLGEENEKRLMETIAEEDGTVLSNKIIEVFRDILTQIKEENLKKSKSSQA